MSMQQLRRSEATASTDLYVIGKFAMQLTASKDPASPSLVAPRLFMNALERTSFRFLMVRDTASLRSKRRTPPSFVQPAVKRRSRPSTQVTSLDDIVLRPFEANLLAIVVTEADCSCTITVGLLRAMHPSSVRRRSLNNLWKGSSGSSAGGPSMIAMDESDHAKLPLGMVPPKTPWCVMILSCTLRLKE